LSCTDNIERLKKGPANYKYVLAKSNKFTDFDFFGQNAINTEGIDVDRWTSSTNLYTSKWKRLSQIKEVNDFKMYGESGNPEYDETKQGNLGNCYFISSIAAAAGYPDLIKSVIITPNINE